jgi:predicted PurR-regulated permease PerM
MTPNNEIRRDANGTRTEADQAVDRFLSDRQKALIGTGLTVLAVSCSIGFAAVLAVFSGRVLASLQGVLAPILVAAVLAMFCKPYYDWLHRVLRRSHVLAMVVFFVSTLIPIGLLAWTAGALIVGQGIELLRNLPEIVEHTQESVVSRIPALGEVLSRYGLSEWLNDQILTLAQAVKRACEARLNGGGAIQAGASVLSLLGGLLNWMVLPVYLGFFLMRRPVSGTDVESFLPFLKPNTRTNVVYLIDQFLIILTAFFRGQVLVALIQGVLFGIGFWCVGLSYGLFIGLALGALNILPYMGNLVGLLVALPMALAEGGVRELALVMAVFLAVQTLDSYVITPKVMGRRTGLHPVGIIFSLLLWTSILGGFFGLMLGVPLSAFVVVLWRVLKNEYIKEIV